jgi:hypothetical protein
MSGLELAAGGMSVGSGIMGVVSAFGNASAKRQQLQAKSQADYVNSALSLYNADLADRNAGLALEEGESDALQKRAQSVRTLHSIRAAFGSNGLDVGASSLDVLQDAAMQGALDEEKINFKAGVTAMTQRDKAAQYRAEAWRNAHAGENEQEAADNVSALPDIFSTIFKTGTSLLNNRDVARRFE